MKSISCSQALVEGNFAKLPPDPAKNSINLKFGTKVRDSVKNDQKKSPIDYTLGTSFFWGKSIHYIGL